MAPTLDTLLPVAHRTESFWLTERDLELKNARTTAQLPSSADVVVVGSGLTGAMTAYHLYKQARLEKRQINVVMLEADEVCGSATARNGGHCKPLTFLGFRSESSKHGPEIANQLLTFEEAAIHQYAALVEEEDIDCDLHVTRAFDVCFTKDGAREAKADWEARKAAYPGSLGNSDVRVVENGEELEKVTGIRGGYWGASYVAGHLWPYKLATALIKICMKQGMNLQTYTPATSLSKSETDPSKWNISTPRGAITAQSIIVATNAYTSSLLPEFKPLIIPVRGTACSITPPPSHSPGNLPGPLKYSYGLRHGTGEVDYMIPRQGRGRVPGRGDRSIILGGAKGCFLNDIDVWYDNKYDNEEMPGVRKYFEGFMEKHFVGWKGNDKGNVDHVWSGVLGYSSDLLPYVGEIPGKDGVFICAGFTGHGMPRIPGCTLALSQLVSSRLASGSTSSQSQALFNSQLPKPYWMTKERLESRVNLIQAAMGQGRKGLEKVTSGAVAVSDEVAMLAQAVEAKM